jgi:hypothetical protein
LRGFRRSFFRLPGLEFFCHDFGITGWPEFVLVCGFLQHVLMLLQRRELPRRSAKVAGENLGGIPDFRHGY